MKTVLRSLIRAPGYTIPVIGSLALGIMLVATVASVINAYLARSLPYPDADRLYHVRYAPPGPWEPSGMSGLDWTSVADVVAAPITAAGDTYYLVGDGTTRTLRGSRVSAGFLSGLGVRPVIGRMFTTNEYAPGGEEVALIGHALWRERFGGGDVIGKTIRVQTERQGEAQTSLRIIGVLPPGFWYGRDSSQPLELIVPLRENARTYMVRLRDGVGPGIAEARITAAARAVATDLPADWAGVTLESMHARYTDGMKPVIVAAGTAAALVLATAWVNVAILVLLRTLRRRKEFSIRLAIGAGLSQIARMVAAESIILAAAAAVLGIALTFVLTQTAAPFIETQLGRPAPSGTQSIGINTPVMLVAFGIMGLIAFSLALVPLAVTRGSRLASDLRRAGLAGGEERSLRIARSTLVALEIAGTLVLLIGGSLMVRSVINLLRTDMGIEADGLTRTRVALRGSAYREPGAYATFYAELERRITETLQSPVALANWPPFAEQPPRDITVDGGRSSGSASITGVGPAYFSVAGLQLRAGRPFTTSDVAGTEAVAIVSATLAQALWPNGNAIGGQLRVEPETRGDTVTPRWRTIVGIAEDVRSGYADLQRNDVYVPYQQSTLNRYGSFYLRSDAPVHELQSTLADIVARIDPSAVVNEPVRVSDEQRELASARFMAALLGGFAACAAALAIIGVFGVTAYAVQHRKREIAIRLALGATARGVVQLFLRNAGFVCGAGILLGIAGAAASTRVLANQLYGVERWDGLVVASAIALVAIAALAATWIPARNAGAVEPLKTLNEG